MRHVLTASALFSMMVLCSCDNFGAGDDQAADDHADESENDHESEGGGDVQDQHGAEVTLSAAAVERAGIMVAPVESRSLQPTLMAPARVSFDLERMAHVGTLVAGRVTEVRARLGDQVGEGDVLLVVESPALGEAQINLLHKRALLDAAGPALQVAQQAHERARMLHETESGVTLTEVQEHEAALRAAEAAQRVAEADVRAATDSLRLLGFDQQRVDALLETGEVDPIHRVLAPLAGEVIEREVTVGEFVDNGRDSLLVIADLSTLWVLADVPEVHLQRIAIGARVRVSVAGSTDSFEGEVSYIAPSIDPHTRAGHVRVALPRDAAALRPGIFAQAEIDVLDSISLEPVLAVPDAAVQTIEGDTVVFVPVAGEDNTFAPRHVEVGPPVGGMVPIIDGLTEGEFVVTSGSFILKAELGKGAAEHEH